MAVEASTYVWRTSKQKGSKLLVILALADYANPETGESFPGIAALAKKCRMTTRYLRNILNDLEESGEIKRIIGAGVETDKGNTNRYLICGYVDWLKKVDEIKRDDGVNNSSVHTDDGVNRGSSQSAGWGEQGFTDGVNNSSVNPSVESVNEKEKDTPPNNAGGEITHQQKAAIIEAWWSALPIKPADIKPDSIYKRSKWYEYAENLIRAGVSPARVKSYVTAQTGPKGFYKDKTLTFAKVAADAPAWCAVHYRPPIQRQAPVDFVSDDELDPRIASAFGDMVKALSA